MSSITRKTVIVEGLPTNLSVEDIAYLFRQAGSVSRILPLTDYKGLFTGSAFVQFEEASQAISALSNLSYKEEYTVNSLNTDKARQFLIMIEQDRTVDELMEAMSPEVKQKIKSRLLMSEPGSRQQRSEYESPLRRSETRAPTTATGNATAGVPTAMYYNHNPSVLIHEPKVSCFSGIAGRDTPFGRWKLEVRCLSRDPNYSSFSVLAALRKSLRSPAADVAVRLGENATVDAILRKFESIYGTVMTGEDLLEKFYNAKQMESEDCAAWFCRLEDILYQAVEKEAVRGQEIDNMLKSRFWSGLKETRLKDTLRQTRGKLTIEEMVKEARSLEQEVNGVQKSASTESTGKVKQQAATTTIETSKLDQILKKLNDLEVEIRKNKRDLELHKQSQGTDTEKAKERKPVICYECGKEGHFAWGCRLDQPVSCGRCGKDGHITRACKPLNQ